VAKIVIFEQICKYSRHEIINNMMFCDTILLPRQRFVADGQSALE